jgi:hypothetical protein
VTSPPVPAVSTPQPSEMPSDNSPVGDFR